MRDIFGSILVLLISSGAGLAYSAPSTEQHVCLVTHGTAEWKTVSQLKFEVSNARDELNELQTLRTSGGIALPEDEIQAMETSFERGVSIAEAHSFLVRGEIARFQEAWQHARQLIDGADATRKAILLSVYAGAVEASAQGIDSQAFLDFASGIIDGDEKIHFNDAALMLMRGTVAYVSGSSPILAGLVSGSTGSELDIVFVNGLLMLFKAKLDRSPSEMKNAIETLESVEIQGDDACARIWKGRIELHIADGYLQLIQLKGHEEVAFATALEHARRARQYLDPIDVPVLWGRAHEVSAMLLDEGASYMGRESRFGKILTGMAEEAYDVSRQYR